LDGDHGDEQGSSYRTEQDGNVASRPCMPTSTKKEGEREV